MTPSRRLAERASKLLGRKSNRRGFIAKSALVGSAVAVAPTDFILRPKSAYAAICSCNNYRCDCGALCCDGYTEFCCTIYGTNGCPPGSLYGGWWKVDNSSFCGQGPRYYMDCHSQCGGCTCGGGGVCSGSCNGTRCGCALGTCSNRKAGCTHFRYGQCNQATRCLGPIICRVVTCTAPWVLEPNCTTSVRTDNATRFHDRPCLHPTGDLPTGRLDRAIPGAGKVTILGWALDPDVLRPIPVQIYVNGVLVRTVTADAYRSDIAAAFPSFGGNHGFEESLATGAGVKEICVYANDAKRGWRRLLGCMRVTVPSSAPLSGAIESVVAADDTITVSGYAFVPDSDETVDVDITLDGRRVATVAADGAHATTRRRGVNGERNGHGFEAQFPAGAGMHSLCAEARTRTTGDSEAAVMPLGCRTVELGSGTAPVGELQHAMARQGGLRVVGWALDPDRPEPIVVRVTVDGRPAGEALADRPRDRLGAKYPGHGPNHGFDIEIGERAGRHRVCVYAIASDGSAEPLLGCAGVSVVDDVLKG